MATSKEAQVLAKLLKNADPELRKFAIRNLEESAEGC